MRLWFGFVSTPGTESVRWRIQNYGFLKKNHNRFCKVFFAAVIVRTTAQADSRVQRITCPAKVCRRLADYSSWDLIAYLKKNQNAPRPSEYYSILGSLLVDIRVFGYARILYGIQLIFRSII